MIALDQIDRDRSRDEYIKNYLEWHIKHANNVKVHKTIEHEHIFCGSNLCMSSDASRYAILSENNNISFMGTQLNAQYYPMLSVMQNVSSIVISEDFTLLAVLIDNHFLKIFQISTQKPFHTLEVRNYEKFEFSKDNKFILAYKKGEGKVFNVNDKSEIWSNNIQLKRASFCPNNYVTLVFDKEVKIINIFQNTSGTYPYYKSFIN